MRRLHSVSTYLIAAAFLLLGPMLGLVPSATLARLLSQTEVYFYDFESGTADWQLQSGFWFWATVDGGHALRGTGHGFARLIAHSGDVSSLRFRFRLEDLESGLHANILESFSGGHTRYLVSIFGMNGVRISRQQGTSVQDLGLGFVAIAPNVFHEAQVIVGGGSVDVFVDGEGVVGVDDPTPPPPGYVSFESSDTIVYVDDVEVQMGPEPAPHPRAPRSPLALPPGPDVGPFVGGMHTGSLSLNGNDVLILSQGRYTLREGEINLSGNARLRIEPGAVLVFDRGTSPLNHWKISLTDASALEVDGGNIVPIGVELPVVSASGRASVTIRNARPWLHIIQAANDAVVSIINSRVVTNGGGSIIIWDGRPSVDVRDSKIGAISLFIPSKGVFHAVGLKPGIFADFDLQRDLTVSGIGYNLRMKNVELAADAPGVRFHDRGWFIQVEEGADISLRDSTLKRLVILLVSPSGPNLAVSGLRLNQPISRTVSGVVLSNVTVTGQWGWYVYGSRRATFDDSEGLFVFLHDNAQVLMRNSSMNEFDPRHYKGTLTFENSQWIGVGEIIEGNDFLMAGTVKIDPMLVGSALSWSQSAVTRRYPIRALDTTGKPAVGATITLKRGSESISATTGSNGEASVDLRFTDKNYTQAWQLTTSLGYAAMDVGFFTATPITVGRNTGSLGSGDFNADGRRRPLSLQPDDEGVVESHQ